MRYFFVILFFAFFVSTPAQVNKNFKILGISVVGNETADASTIIANSGLRVGNEIQIPGDQTLEAIRQLWSLNLFQDIQVVIEKRVNDGVFLIIKVQEYPRLERVVFRGYDELDQDELENAANFLRGETLKPVKVQQMVNKIKDLYNEEGYMNAELNVRYYEFFYADTLEETIEVYWRDREDLSAETKLSYERERYESRDLISRIEKRIVLVVDIEENDPVVVREITFLNNKAFDDDELAGEMEETSEAVWWKFWTNAYFDKEKFKDDKDLVEKFYYSNGYRDAEILFDSLAFSNNKQDLEVIMGVYEGPQYRVRDIEFEGNTIYPDEILLTRLGLQKGDVYDYQKFQMNLRGNEQQNDIAALYLDNGYLFFQSRETEERVAEDSIDILIQINEGNQFKVGTVSISGNDKTKDKVIRRELYTLPGDYFNRAAMLRSLQQLANLQYFNVEQLYQKGVDYAPASDSTVNLKYLVEEKSSDYLNASIGYSGSFGFSGAIGVTLTNFSITEPFRLGGGQILSFNWQFGVGNLYRTFTLGFTEPWLYDTPTMVGVEVFDTRQQYIYDLSQTGITLKAGRRLRWPDDYFYVQGRFKYQHNDVIDGGSFYREGKSEQFTLAATITRNNVDNPIFPSQGSKVMLTGELSGGPFLPGNIDYYKVELKADWYRRLLNSNRFAFYAGVDIGYIDELVKGTAIQPFEFYYMGGSGLQIATVPLRGYDDRTVGPRNTNGNIIGGRVSMRYTTELRFAVSLEPMPLYVLAFAEAGRVFEYLSTMEAFNLRRSAGFGARILINPVGLLGFDFGYGFDRRDVDGQDPDWQFHFQFGQGF